MSRSMSFACAAAGAVLVLSACGTTEDPEAQQAADEAEGGPVSVTDSRGEEVSLDAPAQRIAVLEWGDAEMAATLGVMPAGVAQAEDYATWVTSEPLDDSVEDLGNRQEPSVDAIMALEPDLVITESDRGEQIIDQLEEQVPVLVTTGSDASGNLDRMREDFQMIAALLGKDSEAEEILSGFDTALEEGRAAIEEAGAAGDPVMIADGWEDGGSVSIRTFGDGALATEIAVELGLENAWDGEVEEVWGLGETDVEGLTSVEDSDVRFLYNASDDNDLFADELEGNEIWDSLPFVEAGRVHRLTDGIWLFGGPASGEQFIDELVDIHTS